MMVLYKIIRGKGGQLFSVVTERSINKIEFPLGNLTAINYTRW
jgi:hypothetical protein